MVDDLTYFLVEISEINIFPSTETTTTRMGHFQCNEQFESLAFQNNSIVLAQTVSFLNFWEYLDFFQSLFCNVT